MKNAGAFALAFFLLSVVAMAAAAVVVVATAVVVTLTVMVVTVGVGVKTQAALDERLHSCVRAATNSAVYLYAGLGQGLACAAAYAAADERHDAQLTEHTGEGTVTGAVGADYLGRHNLIRLNFIELELLSVAKMLKNLSVFICCRDFHS
jgi:hypothetical protein